MFFPYLGQTLAAIAQPFILNSPGKFASTWFREERVSFNLYWKIKISKNLFLFF
jgi:hypothetical protein